ncbi:MAG: pimeloyl-ACP methyl ester carboxylesterase [Gammaproteobacteria bacterium]|jgi:pimeloyl-ACP methyl ester carboxylesterase
MRKPDKLIFLPGAGGSPEFWRPACDALVHPGARRLLGWPGFGPVAVDDNVHGIDDLVSMVIDEIDQPCALIAQSMGGVVAVRALLERTDLVTHLVLTATSGGVDMSDLGAADWRVKYLRENPTVPRWFVDYEADLTDQVRLIRVPTLLLWGDSDPISPVAVGRRLQALLPDSRLHVVHSAEHDLGNRLASIVAPVIDEHLQREF